MPKYSEDMKEMSKEEFSRAILTGIPDVLPQPKPYEETVNHAPKRKDVLTESEKVLALKNALRYFPVRFHAELAPEFASELARFGRIYMYRFRPDYKITARPIGDYPCRSRQAAAIMLMLTNNLDDAVAQHPRELIVYGGNGAAFQNWAQYLLTMKYLATMTDEQTLVLYSGHPLGLFPSHKEAPRLVITNGMVVPNYSSKDDWERMNALGVSQYGQMTAGSFMYIGPQGIVHGTTITILNAKRKQQSKGASGKSVLFVSSGLGGMSGAQPKAGTIAGVVSVIAEVNPKAVQVRLAQGWVDEVFTSLDKLIPRIRKAIHDNEVVSVAYQGNVVDLWERLAHEDMYVDLGSDQTSLHNPWAGGYYPVGMDFEQANRMMAEEPERFQEEVRKSLRRQVNAINRLTARGMYFFDYGMPFCWKHREPGPMCSMRQIRSGIRRMCRTVWDLSILIMDSDRSDGCVLREIPGIWQRATVLPPGYWKDASQLPLRIFYRSWRIIYIGLKRQVKNKLVVGSQARILYLDAQGRIEVAKELNDAIRRGEISAPVVLGRDHHDVSGTDSPFRETSNIYDGSSYTADMAVQNVVGDAFRGATWVSLHNGGGVGWGEVINGGFGLVIDGSAEAERRLRSMLYGM
jgi:Urocanate hydratase